MMVYRQERQCEDIKYLLIRKSVKNINMRIDSTGKVVISANPIISLNRIDEFVHERREWILKHQEKATNSPRKCEQNHEIFTLFGRTLKIKYLVGKVSRVYYDDDYLFIQVKGKADYEKVLIKFVDQLCSDIYIDIIGIMRKTLYEYDIPMPVLKIRTMRSRWGSCIPKKQQITLNRRLIHYPIEFIEYVVLHELVHFIQPNHSKEFYDIIKKHMGDYKERIRLSV